MSEWSGAEWSRESERVSERVSSFNLIFLAYCQGSQSELPRPIKNRFTELAEEQVF